MLIMIVLKLIHRCLTILGLCVEPSCNEIYASIVNYIITSFVTGFLLITVEFIFTHFDDRANALYALMQFVTFVTVWTCYICFAKKKRATFQFIGEMQRIVNRSSKLNNNNNHTFFYLIVRFTQKIIKFRMGFISMLRKSHTQ